MAIRPIEKPPSMKHLPLGQNVWILDYYTRSKVDCERMLWQMADAGFPSPSSGRAGSLASAIARLRRGWSVNFVRDA